MFSIIKNSWALLLGILLLMLGNGLHGTLLAVRGEIEQFSTLQMSIIMSAYFVGFLIASRLISTLIRRVGHVRVFAALGSIVSAVLIIFPLFTFPLAWVVGRTIIGFCFCGVYITAESWLNNSADNEHRGQALSIYMVVQTLGLIAGQWLLLLADPGGYVLFIIISILVSLSFAPILLSISPTPPFKLTKPMGLKKLMEQSPLGCIGMLLLGGVFAALFGMAPVFCSKAGLNLGQISMFVASLYIGAVVFQFPVGWLSDRMDRRLLILIISIFGALGAFLGIFCLEDFTLLLCVGFVIGGSSIPLYSLLIAHANDFIELEDMVSASGGLHFINGLGAISGPIVVGWMMEKYGSLGFFQVIFLLLFILTLYSSYRMTQRSAVTSEESGYYASVIPTASPIAHEIAQEYAMEVASEENIKIADK